MEDPRIISALFIFLKMAYYNVLINTLIVWQKVADEDSLKAKLTILQTQTLLSWKALRMVLSNTRKWKINNFYCLQE